MFESKHPDYYTLCEDQYMNSKFEKSEVKILPAADSMDY